jgi:hypothetical protein
MRRLVTNVTLALLLAGCCLVASAQAPFAALSINSAGPQVIDITTGITTLPKGGSVVDRDTGVAFDAAHIRYLDGAFIEATNVTLEGAFGLLSADSVRIEMVDSLLTASGNLRLERDGLTVTAAALRFYALSAIAVFDGGVTGTEPAFNAERVLLDVINGDVLLVGTYSFTSGLFTMTSPTEGGTLELRLHEVEGVIVYDAATDVSPELLQRFSAHL